MFYFSCEFEFCLLTSNGFGTCFYDEAGVRTVVVTLLNVSE